MITPRILAVHVNWDDIFNIDYHVIIDMNSDLISEPSIIKALRTKGYRATSQRIAISRVALSGRDHPTAKRIYEKVRGTHPTVSLATVYKTLQVLRELGLLQELAFPETEAKFDSYMEPHLNLICDSCGEVMDLEDHTAEEILRVASKSKFSVRGQRIDIYGICQKCRLENKKTLRTHAVMAD
jgi:Fur family peroxide stress response transcriptional regulator